MRANSTDASSAGVSLTDASREVISVSESLFGIEPRSAFYFLLSFLARILAKVYNLRKII